MPFASINRPCARCCDVYKCLYCPERRFETASALIWHLKKSLKHKCQPKYTKFNCQKCNAEFQSKHGYIHHLQQKRLHKYDLHQAACCGRFQDVARFIQNENANETGASHVVKSGELSYQLGMTPMHCAAFKGYSRCLRIMLSWQDGDPNIADEIGQTPVHLAAKCGKASSLQLLLSKGGRFDLEDDDGKIAMELATDQCIETIIQHEIATMIRKGISKFFTRGMEEYNFHSHAEVTEIDDESSSTEDKNTFPVSHSDNASLAMCPAVPCPIQDFQAVAEDRSDASEDSSCSVSESKSNVIVKIPDCSQVSPNILPCEVIARGQKAINAFKTALQEGTSSVSRLKIIVVGDVRAGKTSLIRSLSGQPFVETREETHGIATTSLVGSIVQNTELNVPWKLANSNDSHLDELIARVVSDTLKGNMEKNEIPGRRVPELPPSPTEFNVNQILTPVASTGQYLPIPTRQGTCSEVLITDPSISVEGSPRKLPASLIAKNLLKKTNESESVKVNIWDFAGHHLYEPMHHLFMNNRSLYLVVFNLKKMVKSPQNCLCRIHYWLNSIASHTSASTPVILVGTHKAKLHNPNYIKEANKLCEKHFASMFGQRLVRGFNGELVFAVENSESEEDEGITDLKNVIKHDVLTNDLFINEKFPLKWLHCEEEIIKHRQNADANLCMTSNELKKLLEERCMVKFTEEEFYSMISFFHDSGLVLLPGNMCGVKEDSLVKDLVILSPQYLVDIMTSIHDAPKNRSLQRQFSDEFGKLQSEGRIDSHVLEHIWRDKKVEGEVLVELLSCFNILYPISNTDLKEEKTQAKEYIIPCMLKNKSEEQDDQRWMKACEKWKNVTDEEDKFVFDFGRYLPPALFDYLLVHIYRRTCFQKGFEPILKRRTAIFSMSNKFLFRLKLVLKDCQIWVQSRCQKNENFLDLARMLKEMVYEISQQYFKYLKFAFGPPCPREDCPGATFHYESIQRPCESGFESGDDAAGSQSSDDESDEKTDVIPEVNDFPVDRQNERRCHVIHLNLDSFDPPYWCQEVDISEDLKKWDPTIVALDEDENECVSSQEKEINAPNFYQVCVQECCLQLVAEGLGGHWKELGRKLHVKEAEIENIDADFLKQLECGFQVLLKWKQRFGTEALVSELINSLNNLPLKEMADKLREHCLETHDTTFLP
ncbi:uncharacterized protein LOC114515542 isoform X2 [Dendronephthya gigantea]|uniref:uncharacterized protein LOC114515542 isoform X2 n=1 Tax=Dendronephthya gigantea TaxID=151771 RepID=UPI00106BAEB5|nr:uncharacterized protein LOC114515542 isoform X2 [Dendronephthya gigantea]